MQVNENVIDESDSQSFVWMVVLSEKQNQRFLKLLDKPKTALNKTGYQSVDYALEKLSKRKKFPDWLIDIDRPIVDHALYINDNLFVLYPYGFYHNQFLQLAKHANSNGFKIQVNPTLRGKEPCIRIILWKEPNHVPTKNG